MTLEEKQLLLIDLCARLPYKVRIETGQFSLILYNVRPDTLVINDLYDISIIKPYLRSMSSMTNDEKEIYESFIIGIVEDEIGAWELTNWLNSHHFDYNGLIKKGLALEAPEGMYNN